MALAMEILTEIALDEIGMVVPNDSARSSFTVRSADSVLALDADLAVAGRWPVGRRDVGWHATAPGRGLALISGRDEVRLLDRQGRVRWRHRHRPWDERDSGCAWFDQAGEPHAVILAPGEGRCLVLRLDLDTGWPVARTPIEAWPAGFSPIHHPDGWVGLSEGEGQDAARAWWARSRQEPGGQALLEVLAAGWDEEVLCDVNSSGTQVLTVLYPSGPMLVRSFPGLRVLQAIGLPRYATGWRIPACFAGDLILAHVNGYGLMAFHEDGTAETLDDQKRGWLIPAARGSWLMATRTTIQHARIAGEPPSQTIPLF